MDIKNNKKFNIIITIISILVCTFLQIILIFNINAWGDEVFTIVNLKKGWSELWSTLVADVHPPLYYIIAKIIYTVFNYKFKVLKLVSILPICLNIVLVSYLVLKNKKSNNSKKTGILLSLYIIATTITSNFLWMGQELRMYSWAMFFVTGSGIFAYRFYKEQNKINLIAFVLFSLGSALTHYWALIMECFIYLYLFIAIILFKRKAIKKFAVVVILTILGYIWWLPTAIKQLMTVRNDYWITFNFYEFRNYFSNIIGNEIPIYIAIFMIGAILACIMYNCFFKNTRYTKENKEDIIFCIASMTIVLDIIVLAVILNVLMRPIFIARYMLPALGLFWLGLIGLLNYVDYKKIFVTIIAIILIYMSFVGYTNKLIEEYDTGTQATIDFMNSILQEDDILITNIGHFSYNVLEYYFPNEKGKIYDINDFNFDIESKDYYYIEDTENQDGRDKIEKAGYEMQFVYTGSIDKTMNGNNVVNRYQFNVYKLNKYQNQTTD